LIDSAAWLLRQCSTCSRGELVIVKLDDGARFELSVSEAHLEFSDRKAWNLPINLQVLIPGVLLGFGLLIRQRVLANQREAKIATAVETLRADQLIPEVAQVTAIHSNHQLACECR
jgi:hypothetical protein